MSDLMAKLLRLLARWFGIEYTPLPTPPIPPPNPEPPPRPPTPAPVPSDPAVVVAAINAARGSSGLGPLALDPRLERAAESWATAMASRDGLTHGDFAGRITAVYPNTAAGEDIAEGQPTADAVVAAWMQSPPHRANILGAFDRVGAGAARDEAGTRYWCADFDAAG